MSNYKKFLQAVKAGKLGDAQKFFTKLTTREKEYINTRDKDDEYGSTPLIIAVMNDDQGMVAFLLGAKADPQVTDRRKWTPLKWASSNGYTGIAQLLLSNGAKVDAPNKYHTSLHLASSRGHKGVAQLLLNKGADTNAVNYWGDTSLHMASENGHTGIAQLLLSNGAKVDAPGNGGFTSLHLASREGHTDIAQLLLNKGAAPNAANNEGFTPLHLASWRGHTGITKLLLNKGAKVDVTDKDGCTPIDLALRNRNTAIIDILNAAIAKKETMLQKAPDSSKASTSKANEEITNNKLDSKMAANYEQFVQAVREGKLADAQKFLASLTREEKKSINIPGKDRWTLLHSASRDGFTGIVRLLLNNGATIDATDKNDWTPLHYASHYGYTGIAKLLLENGAKVEATDECGRTPLHWASFSGQKALVKVLLSKGAKVDATDEYGRTPLFTASRYGHTGVAKLLLNKGAKVDATDKDGKTPLHIARCKEMKDVLIAAIAKKETTPRKASDSPEASTSSASKEMSNDEFGSRMAAIRKTEKKNLSPEVFLPKPNLENDSSVLQHRDNQKVGNASIFSSGR